MKDKQPVRTFIIQNKQTKQQWKARSGKIAWKNKAAAKNAFANTYEYCAEEHLPSELKPYFKEDRYGRCHVRFDLQRAYEVIEVKSEALVNVDNLVSTFKEIEDNAFILTEEHKEFISNFISNFGG